MGYYTLIKLSETQLHCIRFKQRGNHISSLTQRTKLMPTGVIADGEVVDEEALIKLISTLTTPNQRKRDQWLVVIETSSVLTFNHTMPFKSRHAITSLLGCYGEQWLPDATNYELSYRILRQPDNTYQLEGTAFTKSLYTSYNCLNQRLGCTVKSILPYRSALKLCLEKTRQTEPSIVLFMENDKLWGGLYTGNKLHITLPLVGGKGNQSIRVSEQLIDQVDKLLHFHERQEPSHPISRLIVILPRCYVQYKNSFQQLALYYQLDYHFIEDAIAPSNLKRFTRYTYQPESVLQARRQHKQLKWGGSLVAMMSILGIVMISSGLLNVNRLQQLLMQQPSAYEEVLPTTEDTDDLQDEATKQDILKAMSQTNQNFLTLYQKLQNVLSQHQAQIVSYQLEAEKMQAVIYIEATSVEVGIGVVKEMEKAMADYTVDCLMGEWMPGKVIQLKVEVSKSEVTKL